MPGTMARFHSAHGCRVDHLANSCSLTETVACLLVWAVPTNFGLKNAGGSRLLLPRSSACHASVPPEVPAHASAMTFSSQVPHATVRCLMMIRAPAGHDFRPDAAT